MSGEEGTLPKPDKENTDEVILNRIEGVMTDIKRMMRNTRTKH
jgi:hypothetical protein